MFTEDLPKIQEKMEILNDLSDIMEQNQCHITHVCLNSDIIYPHVLNLKYIRATPTACKRPDDQLHCSKTNITASSQNPESYAKLKV